MTKQTDTTRFYTSNTAQHGEKQFETRLHFCSNHGHDFSWPAHPCDFGAATLLEGDTAKPALLWAKTAPAKESARFDSSFKCFAYVHVVSLFVLGKQISWTLRISVPTKTCKKNLLNLNNPIWQHLHLSTNAAGIWWDPPGCLSLNLGLWQCQDVDNNLSYCVTLLAALACLRINYCFFSRLDLLLSMAFYSLTAPCPRHIHEETFVFQIKLWSTKTTWQTWEGTDTTRLTWCDLQ